MTEKKHTTKPKALHVLSSGEVQGTITEKRSNSGFVYKSLELSRNWSNSTTGRRVTGTVFFLTNLEDLMSIIRQAAPLLHETYAAPMSEDAAGPLEDYEHESRKMEYESQDGRHAE
jgi:hypothetical protein